MQWFIDNKEWVFSGIGVFIIGLFITWLSNKNMTKRHNKMKQKSGDNSINIQIDGDYNNGQNETNYRR